VIGDFWASASRNLADRLATASVPALVFWLGGLLAWLAGDGGVDELRSVTDWLERQSSPAQVAAILTVLLGVSASGVLVARLVAPALRALEGYWPPVLDPLRRRLTARQQGHAEEEDEAIQELLPEVLPPATPTAGQLLELSRLERRRRHRPNAHNRFLPTRIGNALRAAETWPEDKYGLHTVAVWPRLWLVLPESARDELVAARAALDGAVAAAIWGLLFCGFAIWSLWAIPVGLAVAGATLAWWLPARAETYGDLVESAFDIHRVALYEALRWPLPENPAEERAAGERLTSYLWRGSDDSQPTFTRRG
jgi:hypothetical protein